MWARFANLGMGIWLMLAPGLASYSGAACINHIIAGALIASFSVIGIWEVVRQVRWINFVLGIWLIVSPFLLPDSAMNSLLNSMLSGFLVTAFSLVKGRITNRFNGGWRMLWSKDHSRN